MEPVLASATAIRQFLYLRPVPNSNGGTLKTCFGKQPVTVIVKESCAEAPPHTNI